MVTKYFNIKKNVVQILLTLFVFSLLCRYILVLDMNYFRQLASSVKIICTRALLLDILTLSRRGEVERKVPAMTLCAYNFFKIFQMLPNFATYSKINRK